MRGHDPLFLYSIANNNITFLSKFSAISVQSDIPIRLKGQISERTSEFPAEIRNASSILR